MPPKISCRKMLQTFIKTIYFYVISAQIFNYSVREEYMCVCIYRYIARYIDS